MGKRDTSTTDSRHEKIMRNYGIVLRKYGKIAKHISQRAKIQETAIMSGYSWSWTNRVVNQKLREGYKLPVINDED